MKIEPDDDDYEVDEGCAVPTEPDDDDERWCEYETSDEFLK